MENKSESKFYSSDIAFLKVFYILFREYVKQLSHIGFESESNLKECIPRLFSKLESLKKWISSTVKDIVNGSAKIEVSALMDFITDKDWFIRKRGEEADKLELPSFCSFIEDIVKKDARLEGWIMSLIELVERLYTYERENELIEVIERLEKMMNKRRNRSCYIWMTQVKIMEDCLYHTFQRSMSEKEKEKLIEEIRILIGKFESDEMEMSLIDERTGRFEMKEYRLGVKVTSKNSMFSGLKYSLLEYCEMTGGKASEDFYSILPKYGYPPLIWLYRSEENKWRVVNIDFGFADLIMRMYAEDETMTDTELYCHDIYMLSKIKLREVRELRSWFVDFGAKARLRYEYRK